MLCRRFCDDWSPTLYLKIVLVPSHSQSEIIYTIQLISCDTIFPRYSDFEHVVYSLFFFFQEFSFFRICSSYTFPCPVSRLCKKLHEAGTLGKKKKSHFLTTWKHFCVNSVDKVCTFTASDAWEANPSRRLWSFICKEPLSDMHSSQEVKECFLEAQC